MDITELTNLKLSPSNKPDNNISISEKISDPSTNEISILINGSPNNSNNHNNCNINQSKNEENPPNQMQQWNMQNANSSLLAKSRLKSPEQGASEKKQGHDPTISLLASLTPWTKSNSNYNGNKQIVDNGDNKNKTHSDHLDANNANNTPWDRILQCFSVFKPKKISQTDLQANLKTPELKRNMTESDFFLYELANKSEILSNQDTKNLGKHLPPRAIGYPWELTFSTASDGFSLHSLYRKMEEIDSPVLLVIEDIEGRVFGAIVSCAFKVSEHFYGNSDTFLFRCRPNFEVFKWSGNNFFFIQGQDNFISVGSDDGKFGLWLDDNLYLGRTEECSTFSSPALVEEKDFKIKNMECWTVGII